MACKHGRIGNGFSLLWWSGRQPCGVTIHGQCGFLFMEFGLFFCGKHIEYMIEYCRRKEGECHEAV